MPKKKLTSAFVKSVKVKTRTELFDEHTSGLGLRVSPSGHKSFFYRYRYNGKTKRYQIGSFSSAMTLSKARDRTDELKMQVKKGEDPQGEERKKRTNIPKSFEDLATVFKEIHLKPLREKTREEHKRIIDNELIPAFGMIPAKELSKAEIIAFLDNKAIKEGKKTMANRIRARLHSIYEFGLHRGIVDVNPVTGIKRYPEGETKRERYYSEKEIRHLWKAFEQHDEPAQSVLKMLLITGQRKTETMKMRWSDISDNIWTIPAELAKGKRSHDVPLSEMALDILEKMKSINWYSEYVFNSPVLENRPVDDIKRSVKKVKEFTQDDFTVKDFRMHDLRRTAATYMAKLNVDRTTLGKLLNHKGLAGDGQVTAIYDRHSYLKEKKDALDRWSREIKRILQEKQATVHHLKKTS